MRVVSGNCKGKALKAVPGSTTRPTTDKVKEAIFNMIGPYFNGGIALDLFAGSGGLGIEALSRGVGQVIFVDRDAKAIQIIQENIKSCQLENQAEVYRNDADRSLKAVMKRGIVFDYIFLDPPYMKQQLVNLMAKIDEYSLLNDGGMIICEHSRDIELPENVGPFFKIKYETYGIIAVSIYQNGSEE